MAPARGVDESGTTLTGVKVPKFRLSVKKKIVLFQRQLKGKLRNSYPVMST